MAKRNNVWCNLVTISKDLDISKLYLEQIFTTLKKADLVTSVKGPQGGYKLSNNLENITLFDILSVTENNLFNNESNISLVKCPEVSMVIANDVVNFIDEALKNSLIKITLKQLVKNTENYANDISFVYYI